MFWSAVGSPAYEARKVTTRTPVRQVAAAMRIPVDRDHRFQWIAIIDSGDPDHSGYDGAFRLPLTVFNRR
jgi:hypothetical protein